MGEPIGSAPTKYIDDGAADASLLVRVAAGDRDAFHALYRRYAGRVMAVVRRKVPERQLAEEIVQDVFVAAWASARTYRAGLGHPDVWLLGIARHKVQDHWRRVTRVAAALDVVPDRDAPAAATPDSDVRLTVAQALDRLSGEQRRVVDLIYGAGLTFTEAARALRIPTGTVKSRVSAALARMKGFLGTAASS